MHTSAPTVRARDLEVAELRKANAELVKAVNAIAEHLEENDDTGAYLIARATALKHGG